MVASKLLKAMIKKAKSSKSKTKKIPGMAAKKQRAYELSYSPKERVKREAYKRKNGMFPEDDPKNYLKGKGKTGAKKMRGGTVKKKMRGGTVKKKMRGGKVKK